MLNFHYVCGTVDQMNMVLVVDDFLGFWCSLKHRLLVAGQNLLTEVM